MTDILQIFAGNPLTSFVGKKIEAATRPELESDDWALNLEICDIINENEDDAKDAVRAIRKRLQQIEQDRNFAITNRTLTVLETCVSNCSHRFHLLVMTKDFIQDLVKLIGPKNNPPIELQERVLRLIERWAEAFRPQPDLNGVVSVYHDLKSKGVTFPQRDSSFNVPIETPQRSVPVQQPMRPREPDMQLPEGQVNPLITDQGPIRPVVLEGEGYNKISQDLGLVETSVQMFTEILNDLEAKSEDADWQLANDLNTTCRQMKDRIVDLIERVANEDLTIELLRLNDNLNKVFILYRDVKNRYKPSESPRDRASTNTAASTIQTPPKSAISRTENELSLIDFNADDHSGGDVLVATKPKAVPVVDTAALASSTRKPSVDPFDTSQILAKIGKTSTEQTNEKATSSLAKEMGQLTLNQPASSVSRNPKAMPEEVSSVREQDFAEIENWLSNDSGRDLTSIAADMPSIEPISIPNSEFENFIASRALAGSHPSTNVQSAEGGKKSSSGQSRAEPSL